MITQKSKPSFDLLQGEANQVLIALNQLKEDLIEVVADHFNVSADQIGGGSTGDESLDSALNTARELQRGR